MSQSATNHGLQITPLSVLICGALWAIVVALLTWNLKTTVELAQTMNALPGQVADHEQRLRALEHQGKP